MQNNILPMHIVFVQVNILLSHLIFNPREMDVVSRDMDIDLIQETSNLMGNKVSVSKAFVKIEMEQPLWTAFGITDKK